MRAEPAQRSVVRQMFEEGRDLQRVLLAEDLNLIPVRADEPTGNRERARELANADVHGPVLLQPLDDRQQTAPDLCPLHRGRWYSACTFLGRPMDRRGPLDSG